MTNPLVLKALKNPPKWSVLPAHVKSKMTAAEKKTFDSLIKKEKTYSTTFHRYEVVRGQETKAWKYYGLMFKTIDTIEKLQKKLKAKYA